MNVEVAGSDQAARNRYIDFGVSARRYDWPFVAVPPVQSGSGRDRKVQNTRRPVTPLRSLGGPLAQPGLPLDT